MRERMNALEDELQDLRELPEQVAELRAEREALAKKLAKYERRSRSKSSKSGASKDSDRFTQGWGVPAIVFGFYPSAMAVEAIADGTLYFDEGPREALLGIQVFEWSATLGFLIMGLSLVVIGVALLAGRTWALRAQDYWAMGSFVFVVSVVLLHRALTGYVSWEMAFHLMYPAAISVPWLIRTVAQRTQ
ncbi:MAG: hypothetical protein DRJ42_28320 [Deltaproteobacteria bacterium]|nr:MAG: hypothetical protein DRJ42_28320 [Deltaproteobacteria bacterium]